MAGLADDLPAARVDVDPYDATLADELQPVTGRPGIEFRAEIVEAAHLGHDATLDDGKAHDPALLQRLQRGILLAALLGRGAGPRESREGRGGGKKEGDTQCHYLHTHVGFGVGIGVRL